MRLVITTFHRRDPLSRSVKQYLIIESGADERVKIKINAALAMKIIEGRTPTHRESVQTSETEVNTTFFYVFE